MATTPLVPEKHGEEKKPEIQTEELAIKPLIYILVLPMVLLILLQWSGLPSRIVSLVTGH